MKTKKILAVALALLMVAALFAGCGESAATSTPATQAPAANNDTPATQAPAASNETPASSETETEAGNAGGETAGEGPIYYQHESKGTIKVGHLVDLTGVEAATGNQAKAAFDFDVANALMFGDYEIEVVELDCQSNSGIAATNAAAMVEQGCVAIFGPSQIGHKTAVANQLAEDGVPLILYNGTPGTIPVMLNNEWVIGEGGTTAQLPTAAAHYAYEELGYRRVYTIRQDTTGGDNYVGPFEEVFTALGGEVIDSIRLTVGGADYSSLLATLDTDADAICGWTSSNDAINFWTSWYELGLADKLPVLGTMHGGFTDFYIWKQLDGKDPAIAEAAIANNTLTTINYCYSIPNEQNAEFLEIWKAGHDGAVPGGNNLAGACWQALELLERALAATDGDTDPEAVAEALLNVSFVGPEGNVNFEGSRFAHKDVNIAQLIRLDGNYNYQVVKTYENVGADGLSA